MSKADEWELLKRQFDALMNNDSVSAESIEEILDVQFRRRFSDLIKETARRGSTGNYNWPQP